MKTNLNLKSALLLVCLAVTTTSFSGCVILAPFIQAWKNVGATPGDRMTLMGQRLKRFGEALYWGKGEAVLYLDKEASSEVRKSLTLQREDLRIVESKIKSIEYENDTYTANVEFTVKYFRIPFYIVTDTVEKQVWTFHIGDNWYLQKRELSKEFTR